MSVKKESEFEKVIRPVMKYLCENHHPHMTIIVTGTDAELLEGVEAMETFKYVID